MLCWRGHWERAVLGTETTDDGERVTSQAPPGSRLGKLPRDPKRQGALITDFQPHFWFLVLLALHKIFHESYCESTYQGLRELRHVIKHLQKTVPGMYVILNLIMPLL